MTLDHGADAGQIERNLTNAAVVQLLKERPLFVVIPILLVLLTHLVVILIRRKLKTDQKSMALNQYCSSEECVRCNKYDDTRETSMTLFETFKDEVLTTLTRVETGPNEERVVHCDAEDVKRISNAITDVPEYSPKKKQNPNVVNVNGLDPKPFWNDNNFKKVEEALERNYQVILDEFLALPDKTRWTENTTPHGSWRVFHLINQGIVQPENCELVPETVKIINSLPGVMKHSVFGNVCFSVVDAGTWITPHYGPCNCRIRCHLGLITSPQYHLIVDGVRRRSWRNGQCLFFDDSFLHEVRYLDDQAPPTPDKTLLNDPKFAGAPAASLANAVAKRQRSREGDYSDRASRAVLIVDLWHPDLTDVEIDALNYVFPSSESSYRDWKDGDDDAKSSDE